MARLHLALWNVVEANPCHLPAGRPDGGRFCSTGKPALPEDPARYFNLDERTVLLPLDFMIRSRVRPIGVAHAEEFMQKLAVGEPISRRAPILVRRIAPNRYKVVDGNSTVTVALRNRWKKIPAHIEGGLTETGGGRFCSARIAGKRRLRAG